MLERFLRWIQGRTGQYNDVNELAGFFINGHAKLFVALSSATADRPWLSA